MGAEDYAVVIGIDSYPGAPGLESFTSLEAAERDASDFEEWLREPDGGNVSADHISRALTSAFAPSRPHIKDLVDLFQPLVDRTLTSGRIGRRLYIFLAGHGFSDPNDMDTAALFSAEAYYFRTPHVAGTHYADWFRLNGAFDEIVLVMDCCRATSDMTTIERAPFPPSRNEERASSVRRFYAYATEWGQDTRERKTNGKVRGVFTQAILEALRSGPPNRLGRLTGQRVKDYVHNRLRQLMGDASAPPPQIDVDNQRDIVFLERDAGSSFSVTFHLSNPSGRTLRIEDGGGEPLVEMEVDQTTLVLKVPPGLYKATLVGSHSQLFEVVGEDVTISL